MADLLRGIILRDADDQLVVQATPADIRQFAVPGQREVIVTRGRMVQSYAHAEATMQGVLDPFTRCQPGMSLYNDRGEIVAVVTDLRLDYDSLIETTIWNPWSDQSRTYMPGRRRIDITAVGVSGP